MLILKLLTYVEATSLTAEFSKLQFGSTTKYQLDTKLMVSQGYDGASVMSDTCSGVQKRIKEHAPHAMYIHGHAHVLDLVLADSVQTRELKKLSDTRWACRHAINAIAYTCFR